MAQSETSRVDEVAAIADRLVGHPAPGWTTVLDGGTSIVLRGGGFIVKRPRRGGDSFAAEVAGLEIAGPLLSGVVPELVGVDRSAGVLVMTDLGEGRSVADLLLGDDASAAAEGLAAQAVALAALHDATRDRPPDERRTAMWLIERENHARAAIRSAAGHDAGPVLAAFGQLSDELLGSAGRRVLSPGDVCPDNNVLIDGRIQLFDFEGCGDMHPAMDVAYLALPFPTCWCSFDVPAEVKGAAIEAYVDAVSDPAGALDVDLAVAYFSVVSCGLFLQEPTPGDPAFDAPWISDTGLTMPSPAQPLVHRLRLTAASERIATEYPALYGWVGRCLDRCEQRWPGLEPLPLAPAFRPVS